MKVLGLREAKLTLSECVEKAQTDRVLITKHGKPAAVIIGVAGQDMEDVLLQMDPKFWAMIEARRHNSATVSMAEVRRRYGLKARPRPRRKK